MRSQLSTLALLCHAAATGATSVLLSNASSIITFDAKTEALAVLRHGSVLVDGDQIAGLYEGAALNHVRNDTEVVDCTGKIISPGFIDTHRHGWQTAFKTIGSNTSLAEYFLRYGEYVAGQFFTPEDVYVGQLAGLYEALNAGTTTNLDHAHHTWSNKTSEAGLKATLDSGARVVWGYTFHNVTNFTMSEQTANFRDIMASFPSNNTLVTPAMAYDHWASNPYGKDTQNIMALAREYNVSAMTTHYLGGPWDNANSPELFQTLGFLNGSIPCVFSHASFATAMDAKLLRETNQYIANTPESEMHYGHTHEHSYDMQDQMALGVDTFFTYSTDMPTQARLWLQSARYQSYNQIMSQWEIPPYNPMSVNQAFLMATRKGALALRRPDLGIIAEGAKADLLVYDGRSPGMLGWVDPVAAVLLHANAGDLEHVLVGGTFKKRHGKLTVPDYGAVQDRFLASALKIQKAFRDTPYPAMQGDFSSGFPYVSAREADVKREDGTGYGELFV
ncbi:hypothetical protein E8E12_005352 [Didymella heteroderae]|uniref:Amidohydrolase-related domain-containing protein n=1 Tax=Didymella heteroderae TaxID=1769908 RepID=A0A9P5C205_9PLEO|nr:hypothetical protein E8E12_005352 [Didymella heteroderae]